MSNLQMDPPLGGGAPPRLVVKAKRVARPPMPWAWIIQEEGDTQPLRTSTRLYASAEEAWAVGHAMLERLPRCVLHPPSGRPGAAGSGRDAHAW